MKFKSGDKVYHRTLREQGVFDAYDQWDSDSATVLFTDSLGDEDYLRISHCLLDLVKEDNNA